MSPSLGLLQNAVVAQSAHERKNFDRRARYLQSSLIGPMRKDLEKARHMTDAGERIKVALMIKEQVSE